MTCVLVDTNEDETNLIYDACFYESHNIIQSTTPKYVLFKVKNHVCTLICAGNAALIFKIQERIRKHIPFIEIDNKKIIAEDIFQKINEVYSDEKDDNDDNKDAEEFEALLIIGDSIYLINEALIKLNESVYYLAYGKIAYHFYSGIRKSIRNTKECDMYNAVRHANAHSLYCSFPYVYVRIDNKTGIVDKRIYDQ